MAPRLASHPMRRAAASFREKADLISGIFGQFLRGVEPRNAVASPIRWNLVSVNCRPSKRLPRQSQEYPWIITVCPCPAIVALIAGI